MFLCFHLLYFLWCVQPLMQNSMVYGDFMASAHTSVNVLSAKYNHNKRQYNYTTTNNFLEQIRLYDILLDKKKNHKRLSWHMVDLVNGMQMLFSERREAAAFQINCGSHSPLFHSL